MWDIKSNIEAEGGMKTSEGTSCLSSMYEHTSTMYALPILCSYLPLPPDTQLKSVQVFYKLTKPVITLNQRKNC